MSRRDDLDANFACLLPDRGRFLFAIAAGGDAAEVCLGLASRCEIRRLGARGAFYGAGRTRFAGHIAGRVAF